MKKDEFEQLVRRDFQEEAERIKKNPGWFRFAEKAPSGGWRFLPNRQDRWELLEKIANKLAGRYPEFTTGEVVDLLAEIVNNAN